MNSRCLKRIKYVPADDGSHLKKHIDTPKHPNDSRNMDITTNNIHAIGVGELMECKLLIM